MQQHRLVVLTLAVALLALPASAAAGTKSASATAAGDGAIASATAKCPRGQKATGGGFTAPSTEPFPRMQVYESRKVGQRSWRASGQVFGVAPVTPFTLTAYAYCSATAPATKSKSASVTSVAPSAALSNADAKCSSGKAQAGGFLGPPPHVGPTAVNHLVTDSYRADKKTWRSRMETFDPGFTFTSYVYCADEKKPVARSGSATTAAPGAPVTALSPECKRGTKPVAGGFSQPNAQLPPGPDGFFELAYESFKTGKRWRASAVHEGTVSTALNAIAYCA